MSSHTIRFGRYFLCASLAAALVVFVATGAWGQNVTVDPAHSITEASLFQNGDVNQSQDQTQPITGIPYTTPNNVNQGSGNTFISSTVTPDVSEPAFTFTFDQTNSGTQGIFAEAFTKGAFDIVFTPTVNLNFTLSGHFATTGPVQVSEGSEVDLSATLQVYQPVMNGIRTAGLTPAIYTNSQSGFAGDTLTLTTGTGTILAGQTYEFSGYADVDIFVADPTGTGPVTLAFVPAVNPGGGSAAPLPAAAWVGIAMLPLGILAARRSMAMFR